MKQIYPSYYPDFRCIASACGDNCCIGWEIDIDGDTHARYLAERGEMGERLRSNISADGPPHFLLKEDERCPFLNEKNLCEIYLALGEDALCEICTQHPRFHEWFGTVKESGVGLCCEAAARLILGEEGPAAFLSAEIDEEGEDFPEEGLYRAMLPVRELLFAVLQDRARPVGERLAAALALGEAIQACLDGEDPEGELAALAAEHSDGGAFFRAAASCVPEYEEDGWYEGLLDFLLELAPIDARWPEGLRAARARLPELLEKRPAFLRSYAPHRYEYEHLAVYFVYRYLMKAVFDSDALSRVKLAAVSVLALSVLGTARRLERGAFSREDQAELAKNWSKELEYCEENLLALREESWLNEAFSAGRLAGLLPALDR